jgi:hypothetical protein
VKRQRSKSPSSARRRAGPLLAAVALAALGACGGGEAGNPPPIDPGGIGPDPQVLEYLSVSYVAGPDAAALPKRTVLINGKPLGDTLDLIEFEGGRCVISLDGDPDYEPAEQVVVVDGTSPLTPFEVVFRKK